MNGQTIPGKRQGNQTEHCHGNKSDASVTHIQRSRQRRQRGRYQTRPEGIERLGRRGRHPPEQQSPRPACKRDEAGRTSSREAVAEGTAASTELVELIPDQRTTPARAATTATPRGPDPVDQPRPNQKENGDFRSDGLRPQNAYGRGVQPGSAPADHGECVIQRVTAIDQGGNDDNGSKRRQLEKPTCFTVTGKTLVRIPCSGIGRGRSAVASTAAHEQRDIHPDDGIEVGRG